MYVSASMSLKFEYHSGNVVSVSYRWAFCGYHKIVMPWP